MFNAIRRLFASMFAISEASVKYDINHLHVDNRRAWTAPRAAGSKLLTILADDPGFMKHLKLQGNSHTLIRMTVVDSELRVCTYHCSTDPLIPTPIYDEQWQKSGIFHYLFDGKTAELQIRDDRQHLKYDRTEPMQCFTYPLLADELETMMTNWLPAVA